MEIKKHIIYQKPFLISCRPHHSLICYTVYNCLIMSLQGINVGKSGPYKPTWPQLQVFVYFGPTSGTSLFYPTTFDSLTLVRQGVSHRAQAFIHFAGFMKNFTQNLKTNMIKINIKKCMCMNRYVYMYRYGAECSAYR